MRNWSHSGWLVKHSLKYRKVQWYLCSNGLRWVVVNANVIKVTDESRFQLNVELVIFRFFIAIWWIFKSQKRLSRLIIFLPKYKKCLLFLLCIQDLTCFYNRIISITVPVKIFTLCFWTKNILIFHRPKYFSVLRNMVKSLCSDVACTAASYI